MSADPGEEDTNSNATTASNAITTAKAKGKESSAKLLELILKFFKYK